MNPSAFERILALYSEAESLNRQAMARLAASESPAGLAGLFQRKGEIARELEDLAGHLAESRDTKSEVVVQSALEAQKKAALSEVHLSEQLSLWRQASRTMSTAYGRGESPIKKNGVGLDRAG